ncbi:MAG: hypothetical protein P4L99_16680 [Chthoniobacter sp.]|nr:hypothetical protein [Chthoniobacter sp.]
MKKRLFLFSTTAFAVLLVPGVLRAVDLRADDPIPPVPPGKSLPPPLPATPAPASPSTNNQPPQATPGSPGSALQAGGKGQRLQKLKQELGLTPAQVAKIKPILEKAHAEIQAVRANTSLPAAQKRQKVRQIFTASFQQIRPILTPQQLQKWKQIREERHPNATSTT